MKYDEALTLVGLDEAVAELKRQVKEPISLSGRLTIAPAPDAIQQFVRDLELANPAFKSFWPEGMVDLRVTWPNAWRGGTFTRVPHHFAEIEGADITDHRSTDFRVLLGQECDAVSCRDTLAALGIEARLIPPHTEDIECDGDEARIKVEYWIVRFSKAFA